MLPVQALTTISWYGMTVAGTGVCPNLMTLFYFICMLHNLIFPFASYI
jgi:hypothetical protein